MIKLPSKRKHLRIVIPAYPHCGIFDFFSNKITSLGAVLVGTIADKYLPNWSVEIIDENNYHKGPRDNQGLVDHESLQRDTPADAVGFYCGLSSTMPRVWQLTKQYRQQDVYTIAGGWHVKYAPQESLDQGLDLVVTGDGEEAILDILTFYENHEPKFGIYECRPVPLDALPVPDFGLLRFAKMKIYPIGRIRGCSMACEFCSVKSKPRWSDANYLFETVQWLVETRQARTFFITDDRLEEDKAGYLAFFRQIYEHYGSSLSFNVQVRLAAVEDTELVLAMKQAGVRSICIGFESPIEEELRSMRKGTSVDTMIQYARAWQKQFRVHGMFIFGYPLRTPSSITYQERLLHYKRFIKKSKIDSIQILHPVPLIGSALRQRMQETGQLFSLDQVGWQHYDGNFACFQPENMTVEELQWGPTELMMWFYNWQSYIKLPIRTINLPVFYWFQGWRNWQRQWINETLKAGGHRLLKRWSNVEQDYLNRLQQLHQNGMKQINQ